MVKVIGVNKLFVQRGELLRFNVLKQAYREVNDHELIWHQARTADHDVSEVLVTRLFIIWRQNRAEVVEEICTETFCLDIDYLCRNVNVGTVFHKCRRWQ